MNSNKYPVINYLPYNPSKEIEGVNFGHDLNYTLNKQKYEKIVSDPVYDFQNCYITNFDLSHNECRGDKLKHSRKYYSTIFNNKVNEEFTNNDLKNRFISKSIDCERNDLFLEKEVLKEHFMRVNLEKKLERHHIFLSSMKKIAFLKKKSILTTVNLYLFKVITFNIF